MTHILRSVELYLVRLPLIRPFTTSSHTKDHLDHILLRARDEAGAEGWGECASAADPYYCSETTESSWHILRDFLIPELLGVSWDHPDEAAASWAKVRGNNFAKAGLEMACWDLFSRARGQSIADFLGGTRAEIHSGVSLGIEPTVASLLEQVERFLDQGYRRIKMKIGPGRDLAYLRAVRERWPDILLMADANSAYSLDNPTDVQALRALDDLNLMMIEQPLADDDIVDHARLQAQLTTPICLDESIHSVHDARKALDQGSCRIINIKVSRLGGLSEARRVHDLCSSRDVPVWCGGMHEFGVGRAANVAISSLPGFTLPGDVSGSDRAYREDIVDPPIRAHSGAIEVPRNRPGLGFDANLERIRARAVRELVLEGERRLAATHA
ncbi:MAG: o-succinylbenzoate synthase [Chloroflexi bacterium]|nr:o-succinylbenzoate synthase [Chloroflexota bacterium]MBV9603188.1 o-succinylbenzoate synthase [Chloroflexota bacterium]